MSSGAWLYVVVRRELTGGALLAQVAHAASEAAAAWGATEGRPLPTDTRAGVLVATKAELEATREALDARALPHARIDETDGPLAGSTTAVGLVTFDRDSLRPILGALRVWVAPKPTPGESTVSEPTPGRIVLYQLKANDLERAETSLPGARLFRESDGSVERLEWAGNVLRVGTSYPLVMVQPWHQPGRYARGGHRQVPGPSP